MSSRDQQDALFFGYLGLDSTVFERIQIVVDHSSKRVMWLKENEALQSLPSQKGEMGDFCTILTPRCWMSASDLPRRDSWSFANLAFRRRCSGVCACGVCESMVSFMAPLGTACVYSRTYHCICAELMWWSESVDGLLLKLWRWCRLAVPVLYGDSCCSQGFQWLPMTQRTYNVGDKDRTDRLSRGERVGSGGLEVRMVKE